MADLPKPPIDRESPVPFYFQLAEVLEAEIRSGRWEPGARLASEPELSDHYGISRTTVRQALARLQQRGLIARRKGQGTFVDSGSAGLWLLQSSEGFFHDEVDRLGRTVTSRVLHAELGPLPVWACSALEIPHGSHGATLERLRSLDGLVALYVVNHVADHAAHAALALRNPNESLYRRLRDHAGLEPHGGRRTLAAVAAEATIAKLLELPAGAPLAFIESVTWDAQTRPFDCYRAWLRTDRTRIDIQVSAPTAHIEPVAPNRERA